MKRKGLKLDAETLAELGYGDHWDAQVDIMFDRDVGTQERLRIAERDGVNDEYAKAKRQATKIKYDAGIGKYIRKDYQAKYHQAHKNQPAYKERRRLACKEYQARHYLKNKGSAEYRAKRNAAAKARRNRKKS